MAKASDKSVQQHIEFRYSGAPVLDPVALENPVIAHMATRGSCRDFLDDSVPDAIMNAVLAAAFASPTKSDLQQRDVIVLRSAGTRQALASLVSGQSWVSGAPLILIFCGNNRRQRLLHDWHSVPFANDHLDALFNAVGDAAIALGAFVTAAEAVGLGCCPISAVRNEAAAVSELLGLPDHVFPFAGLAVGYPKSASTVAKRLPLNVTCHVDRYQEDGLSETIQHYDQVRRKAQPYASQRFVETFGNSLTYGWSEDKVRQYSEEERADFGHYIRSIGFSVE